MSRMDDPDLVPVTEGQLCPACEEGELVEGETAPYGYRGTVDVVLYCDAECGFDRTIGRTGVL